MNKVLMVLVAALLAPVANAQVSMLPDPGPRPKPARYLLVYQSVELCTRVSWPDGYHSEAAVGPSQCWVTQTRAFDSVGDALDSMVGCCPEGSWLEVREEDLIALIDLVEMRRVPLRLEKVKHVEKREVIEEPWTEYRWRPAP